MSEQTVGRVRKDQAWDQRFGKRERRAVCRDCGMTHGRIRYSHPVQRNPAGPSLTELAAGVVVFLLWMFALLWAMPVIVMAVMS